MDNRFLSKDQPTVEGRPWPAFNDDMIQRIDLPEDAFGLLHDLAYHHDDYSKGSIYDYVKRAQEILKGARE